MSKNTVPEWEKKLIKRLANIKIDHTDFDDGGYNRLCSEEIIKIVDIFDQLLHSTLKKMVEKEKWQFESIVDDNTYWHDDHLCIHHADPEKLLSELLSKAQQIIDEEMGGGEK